MALVAESTKNKIKTAVTNLNSTKQEDKDKAIDAICEAFEEAIHAAIKSITITIPSGACAVTGSSTAQTNAQPIVLENAVS